MRQRAGAVIRETLDLNLQQDLWGFSLKYKSEALKWGISRFKARKNEFLNAEMLYYDIGNFNHLVMEWEVLWITWACTFHKALRIIHSRNKVQSDQIFNVFWTSSFHVWFTILTLCCYSVLHNRYSADFYTSSGVNKIVFLSASRYGAPWPADVYTSFTKKQQN